MISEKNIEVFKANYLNHVSIKMSKTLFRVKRKVKVQINFVLHFKRLIKSQTCKAFIFVSTILIKLKV